MFITISVKRLRESNSLKVFLFTSSNENGEFPINSKVEEKLFMAQKEGMIYLLKE